MNDSNIINNKSSQDNDESNKNSDSDSNRDSKASQPIKEEENKKWDIEVLPENTNKNDLSFKVILIGDSGVGKSSLANKAIKNKFETNYNATIGFDCFSFFVKINNKIIKLQVWDTCGQEVYQSLITNFYRNSSLAIMVYSINNRNTYENLDLWLKELKTESNPDAKIFLIGNKCDLEKEREVTFEEANTYSEDMEFSKFFEASAKEGINAKEIFIEGARLLYEDYIEYKSEISSSVSEKTNPQINNTNKNESKSGCCQ
jgi:small GTP-binding protein